MTGQPLKEVEKNFINEAGLRFGISLENMEFIGGFENYIYQFAKDNDNFVLRIGHSSHQTFNQVNAEIDWILYLLDGGFPSVVPIKSENKEYVEKIQMNEHYLTVVCFEMVDGEHLNFSEPDQWPSNILFKWGKIIGKSHALTKNYHSGKYKRHDLLEYYRLNPGKYIPEDQTEVTTSIKSLIADIKNLPKDPDGYGLIHSDIHAGNFFVKNDEKFAFDFDDACYKWFISDIAITLYYPLYMSPLTNDPKRREIFLKKFKNHFWKGYCSENILSEKWLNFLPLFIKLRDSVLYIVIHEMMDIDKFREQRKISLESHKKRILGNYRYIPIKLTNS